MKNKFYIYIEGPGVPEGTGILYSILISYELKIW